jgi:hypothetical protein
MSERAAPILKWVCLAFAALLIWKLGRFALVADPLGKVTVPAIPIWAPTVETAATKSTNAPPKPPPGPRSPAAAIPKPSDLSSNALARVDRIISSEIFGPVPRPTPIRLFGLTGRGPTAHIQAPTGGQIELLVGEEKAGIKLLEVRPNRVLVEHEGQKKELVMNAGIGSESLLSPGKGNPQ